MSYTRYNANPDGNDGIDCTVRAISVVTGYDWDRTYIELCLQGFMMKNMPSGNRVWQTYLRAKGFRRAMPDDIHKSYTVRDFCRDHPRGVFLLALDGHVVAAVDGDYYDTFDSGDCEILYYWYKER